MFLAAQLIGLAVINAYSPHVKQTINETTGVVENVTITPYLPYGMQPPEIKPEISVVSIIVALLFATLLIFLLSRIKAVLFLRFWFFVVVLLALAITINAAFIPTKLFATQFLALVVALPLAFYKVFERNLLVHNFTELLIYPGIAAIFVPILNIWTALLLLIAISIYDMYAVWHTKFMQKMAKFQIQKVKVFAGFFVPYLTKTAKAKIAKLRKMKRVKLEKAGRKKGEPRELKVKVGLAILGGGDVAFPLIFAGVLFRAVGLISSLIVVLFATISLLLLFVFAKKGKFYPAMPFLTAGCIAGWLLGLLI